MNDIYNADIQEAPVYPVSFQLYDKSAKRVSSWLYISSSSSAFNLIKSERAFKLSPLIKLSPRCVAN